MRQLYVVGLQVDEFSDAVGDLFVSGEQVRVRGGRGEGEEHAQRTQQLHGHVHT